MKILQFPIFRVTIWFVLGIIFSTYIRLSWYMVCCLLVIAIAAFVFYFLKAQKNIKQQPSFAFCLYFLFFLLGQLTTIAHDDSFQKNHYINQVSNFDKTHVFKVVIVEKLKNSANYNRYFACITNVDNIKQQGKILLNFKKDAVNFPFKVGTILRVSDQLLRNFKPNNPNQFDYGKYLETKNIYAQIFTEASNVKISKNVSNNIWSYTAKFRDKIIGNLEKCRFKKEELAVITALILGQQQDISKEVLQDYQYAGAVHILSVSGLHVGFILLFITFLLKPLPKNKTGNFIRLITVLVSLWLFALVAGLAPSVLRSATMFSFVAIGLFLNRETNIFHSLVVSLFLILLFEPLFLFDIGFQLSYIALFFILWLQPMLKALWSPKNKIIEYFWDIITVSFAAQIGAMPLSIYYFHQFPGLFFITNLVLIPCLMVIMALGVLLMLLAYFNYIPVVLSKTVEYSITFTNLFIKKSQL